MTMTNEKAIQILKDLKEDYDELEPEYKCVGFDKYDKIAIDMAIKALEQQPCEDCISREALINELKLGYFNKDLQEGKNDPCVIDAMIDWAIRVVKCQPSVTPKPKTGHWITTRTFMHDGEYYCDKCKCDAPNNEKWDYCPNCGAKMEVEE